MIKINKYIVVNFGVNKIDRAQIKKDFELTDEEISFLNNLEFFPFHEIVPCRGAGKVISNVFNVIAVLIDRTTFLDPMCVALFDYYYGIEMSIKKGIDTGLDDNIKHMKRSKSIFKKLDPINYKLCFI